MRKLFEGEYSFEELDQIPRSNRQKQLTFIKIMNEVHLQTKKKKAIFPKLLTFSLSLAACIFIVSIISNGMDSMMSSQLIDRLEGEKILAVSITPSKSNITFTPAEEGNKKDLYIMPDEDWNHIFLMYIQNAKISQYEPKSAPLYDLVIAMENQETIKLKVWSEKGNVYLKSSKNNKMYALSTEKSEKFIKYIESIVLNNRAQR